MILFIEGVGTGMMLYGMANQLNGKATRAFNVMLTTFGFGLQLLGLAFIL